MIDGIALLAELFDPEGFVDLAPPRVGCRSPPEPPVTRAADRRPVPFRQVRLPLVRSRVATRGPGRPGGVGSLCPDCLGGPGQRLSACGSSRVGRRAAAAGRTAAPAAVGRRATGVTAALAAASPPSEPVPEIDADEAMRPTTPPVAPTYDDWYLRRGGYARGPVLDLAWHMELDR